MFVENESICVPKVHDSKPQRGPFCRFWGWDGEVVQPAVLRSPEIETRQQITAGGNNCEAVSHAFRR